MSKKRKNKEDKTKNIVLIILIIIFILITVGIYTHQEEEIAKLTEINKLQERLITVEKKIVELEYRKNEIFAFERKLLVRARIIIALFLALINLVCLNYKITAPNLNEILNLNEAILLSYSFVAFALYGTPSNLVKALKKNVMFALKKNHINSISELEEYYAEKELIELTIKSMQQK